MNKLVKVAAVVLALCVAPSTLKAQGFITGMMVGSAMSDDSGTVHQLEEKVKTLEKENSVLREKLRTIVSVANGEVVEVKQTKNTKKSSPPKVQQPDRRGYPTKYRK